MAEHPRNIYKSEAQVRAAVTRGGCIHKDVVLNDCRVCGLILLKAYDGNLSPTAQGRAGQYLLLFMGDREAFELQWARESRCFLSRWYYPAAGFARRMFDQAVPQEDHFEWAIPSNLN